MREVFISTIIIFALDWKTFFRKQEETNDTVQQPVASENRFKLTNSMIVIFVVLAIGLLWFLDYRSQQAHQQVLQETYKEGVHVNQYNVSRIEYSSHSFGTIGDIRIYNNQIVIVGEGAYSIGTTLNPLSQTVGFRNSSIRVASLEHKIAVASDGKLRFYNNQGLRDESGNTIGIFDATPGFERVKEVLEKEGLL